MARIAKYPPVLVHSLTAMAAELQEEYEERFRIAGIDFGVGLEEMGVLKFPPAKYLGLYLWMEEGRLHDHEHVDMAEKKFRQPWQETSTLTEVRRRAVQTLERWLQER